MKEGNKMSITAFRGIGTPEMSVAQQNGYIVVKVSMGDDYAEIGGFTSVAQAEEAIFIAQRSLDAIMLVPHSSQTYNFVVGLLNFFASQGWVMQAPEMSDDDAEVLAEMYDEDSAVEEYYMGRD